MILLRTFLLRMSLRRTVLRRVFLTLRVPNSHSLATTNSLKDATLHAPASQALASARSSTTRSCSTCSYAA